MLNVIVLWKENSAYTLDRNDWRSSLIDMISIQKSGNAIPNLWSKPAHESKNCNIGKEERNIVETTIAKEKRR